MFRLPPPRGRTWSTRALVVVVLAVLVATPAAAQGDGDPAIVAVHVSDCRLLTLTVTGVAGDVTVTATQGGGEPATWNDAAVAPPEEDTTGATLSVDVLAPHGGSPPANGPLSLTVAADEAVTQPYDFVLNVPPTPVVSVNQANADRVELSWSRVSCDDPVTYRVYRVKDGTSVTLADGITDNTFPDTAPAPGLYRYGVVAVHSGDGGDDRVSSAGEVEVRVPRAEPTPSPQPPSDHDEPEQSSELPPKRGEPSEPTDTPAPPPRGESEPQPEPRPGRETRPEPEPRAVRPRPVAATGAIRGGVEVPREPRRGPTEPADPTPATADAPGISAGWRSVDRDGPPPVARPQTAPPLELVDPAAPTTAPRVAAPARLPVVVPPTGSLAVEASRAAVTDPVSYLSGLVFLALVGVASPLRRRRQAVVAAKAR